MSRGVEYHACRSCGRAVFPRRALCPRCGGASWLRRLALTAVLEDATTLHRAPGGGRDTPIHLGTVRLDAGPAVVVRLAAPAEPGTRVTLETVAGAPRARAAR